LSCKEKSNVDEDDELEAPVATVATVVAFLPLDDSNKEATDGVTTFGASREDSE
jgi:hypothetical protein